MASATNKLYLTFLDNRGQIAKIAICVAAAIVDPSGGLVLALRSAINLVSDAINNKASVAIPAVLVDTPLTAPVYEDADKALMIFLDANNQTHSFRVPAPIASAFVANTEEIDPVAASVTAFTSAVIANCVTQGGAPFISFKGGRRIRL